MIHSMFPDWFRKTPEGAKVVAREAAEELKTRRAAVAQLASRRRQLEEEHTAAMVKLRKAVEAVDAAAPAFNALRAAVFEADRAVSLISARIDREAAVLQGQLRETADPAIAEAIARLRAQWSKSEELRHEFMRHRMTGAEALAVNAGYRNAIAACEALQIDAEADVPAALEKILAALNEMLESVGLTGAAAA